MGRQEDTCSHQRGPVTSAVSRIEIPGRVVTIGKPEVPWSWEAWAWVSRYRLSCVT